MSEPNFNDWHAGKRLSTRSDLLGRNATPEDTKQEARRFAEEVVAEVRRQRAELRSAAQKPKEKD